MGSGYAGKCQVCDGAAKWTIRRIGDAVITWSCRMHLDGVLVDLQRDHELTALNITLTAKAREITEINRMIIKEMGSP